MKKPFKLNAYYLVDCHDVDCSDATNNINLPRSGKAVVFLDKNKYTVDVFGSVNCSDTDTILFYASEREHCKRCDNKFVEGVRYKSKRLFGVYKCVKLSDVLYLEDENGEIVQCCECSIKDFVPVVGAI